MYNLCNGEKICSDKLDSSKLRVQLSGREGAELAIHSLRELVNQNIFSLTFADPCARLLTGFAAPRNYLLKSIIRF